MRNNAQAEIAQSESRTGEKFVNFWLHAAFLTVDGERMGKSKGNYTLVRDLLAKYDPMLVRLFLVNSHYRKAVDFNQQVFEQTKILLDRIRTTIAALQKTTGGTKTSLMESIVSVEQDFITAMDDDLNTVGALQAVLQFIKKVNASLDNEKPILDKACEKIILLMGILGIQLNQLQEDTVFVPNLVDLLISLREQLRAAQQYDIADNIRTRLLELGIQLEDKPNGTIWKILSRR